MIPRDPKSSPRRAGAARVTRVVAALGALGLALATVAGCSPKRVLVPKLPPETTVFVQGPVDTVSYKAHLYWFGTDPDGYVVAYELRFLHPDAPADSQWVRTTRTDSLFSVYTPTGLSKPILEVRAIDDDGMVDPSPARQAFEFRNQPPELSIVGGPGPRDSTFIAVTASWVAKDRDGDIRKARYQVWLDGNEANPIETNATTLSVPTDQFRNGGPIPGYRTLFVRVIDEGGFAVPDSLRWYVRAPAPGSHQRLLIVDDIPGSTGTALSNDTMYVNTAARNLDCGTWSILRLESTQPFRSASDIEQTFKLFDVVLWYRGSESYLQSVLTSYRDGIARYLESGGRFYIESQLLVQGQGASGIFPEDWVSRYLGSDFLYKHATAVLGDSSVAWSIRATDPSGHRTILRSTAWLGATVYPDSLWEQGIFGQLRGFAVRDTHDVLVWARAGTLRPSHTFDIPVAVSVPQPGGGRLVAVTFPVLTANGLSTVPRFLAKVFEQLGLTGGHCP